MTTLDFSRFVTRPGDLSSVLNLDHQRDPLRNTAKTLCSRRLCDIIGLPVSGGIATKQDPNSVYREENNDE